MAGTLGALATRASSRVSTRSLPLASVSLRTYATVTPTQIPPKPHHRVVIIGGGTAGVTVAAQLVRTKQFQKDDIAIVEQTDVHHYQPGWTLVGAGLKPLSDMERPMSSVIPQTVAHYPLAVMGVDPESNELKTREGVDVSYEYLIVAPGLKIDMKYRVEGLQKAFLDHSSGVSTIYHRKGAEKTWKNIQAFKSGSAIFTQPAGVIKCAGAPQKIMWMALSQWEKNGVRKDILPTFATGGPGRRPITRTPASLVPS